MAYLVGFVLGMVVGGVLVYIINRLQTQTGVGELDGKKKLIDQTLDSMKGNLDKVAQSIIDSDKQRERAFGEVSTQLKLTAEQMGKLQETTNKLQTALAGTKTRGQWGERMAEDVLRFAGLLEHINYEKQQSQDLTATRPDYTFHLPHGKKVNMDVKFPLDNYMKYLDEESEPTKEAHKQQFLRDTRERIKEVTKRDYINPADNTLDYVLVFIPSEQVYCFINENANTILDEALKQKVILCSPLTLYAMLAVIRQAVDTSNLEEAATQLLSLYGTFNKQWGEFIKSMDTMGKRLEQAYKEYELLATTRRRMLERPLSQIDALRKKKGILESPLVEDSDIAEDPAKEP